MFCLSYIKREWQLIWQDGWLRALLIWLPITLFVTMWLIFSAGIARDLPIGVVDLDHSRMSRGLTRYFNASPTMEVTAQFTDRADGDRALRGGDIYALVVLPDSLEKDTMLGYSPSVTVFYNSQFILIAKLLNSAMVQAQATYNASIETLRNMSHGSPVPLQALGQAVPVQSQITPLFNSNSHYGQFLVSAILPAIWQILIVATTVMALAAEDRRQGLLNWLRERPYQKVMSKFVPYFFGFLIQGMLFLWGMYGVLDWPMHGSWLILFTAQSLMVLACISVGCLFYFVAMDTARAMSFVAGFTAPAFAFMGITFPATNMHPLAQMWRSLLPVSHYIEIQLQQVDYGTGWYQARDNLFVLALFIIALILGLVKMHFWRKGQLKHEAKLDVNKETL
ncbi:ABC transporter permease [Photobacterium damselae]|uniref:ABC transporter permease n=1 Tax=Photobacterium damselae TaxID=38293 RepID=UPI001F1A462D|nr:ABC transporter permease [Photobacterium damselae]UKA08772.1 ABC transporter permease [Photobacterium damselae subsp. damselae]